MTTLAAERVGDQVEFHWTTPEKTTDALDVRGPITAVICRRPVLSPEQPCVPVIRIAVLAGASTALDQLPNTLTAIPPIALEYRLELLNASGRSAGASNAVQVASGPSPSIPQQFKAAASQDGVVLTWQSDGMHDTVELHRMTASLTRPAKQSAIGARRPDAADLLLRVPAGDGALDRTAAMGERYTYMAQRVRTVTVQGRTLDVRSAVSPPVSLEMRDVFPPRQPTGLEAVAADRVVDLSWEPNTEPDLAGYIVQRLEADLAIFLNSTPVLQPAFEDKTAASGHTYRYSIVAVDRAGNRSPGSELVPVTVHADVP